MVVQDLEGVVAAFRARAGTGAVFTDFDGALAEIVDDPETARPVVGAPEVLAELAACCAHVAVLSGRPLEFLEQFFEPPVVLAGLYGLEQRDERGRRIDHPQGGAWREAIEDIAAHARAHGPEGMRVESKGLSLTLHYRRSPELEPAVRELAETEAARSGLVVRPARMSYELHPPIATDKGSSLRALAEGLEVVIVIGDDQGDLAAFDALDELEAAGVDAIRVAVDSPELAPELRARADLVLPGPEGVVSLLGALLDRARLQAS